MENNRVIEEKPAAIFLLCLIYAIHMVEEFTLGFVEWADRYLGNFNWTQNLIGNSIFMFTTVRLLCQTIAVTVDTRTG